MAASGEEPRWLRTMAVVTFLALFGFGLALLFIPELANELDRRSSGGSLPERSEVRVTETTQTNEEEKSTRGRASSETKSGRQRQARGQPRRRPRAGRDSERSSTEETTRDEATSVATQTTTTTETVQPGRNEGAIDRAFAVPGLFVLARTAAASLLAFLVAGFLYRAGRSRFGIKLPGGIELPDTALVTPAKADAAKQRIIDGIPLLREIQEARGEPAIEEVLPDMRVAVRLTETLTKEQALPVSLFATDAGVALGTFHGEIEQRLRRLARDADKQAAGEIEDVVGELVDEGLFDRSAADGFRDLLRLTERGIRGGRIDPAMVAWIRDEGVPLLMSLDLMLPS